MVIDILTDDVTTMTTTNDVGTTITDTDMNGIIPENMTGVGMTGAKGTGIFDEIRSEDFSAEKSAGRQREIATQRQHRRIEKRKKPAGTRSRSQVEGSRINGRIRNFPFDFSTLLVILQNTMIPVSYILKYTMKKYENPRFW